MMVPSFAESFLAPAMSSERSLLTRWKTRSFQRPRFGGFACMLTVLGAMAGCQAVVLGHAMQTRVMPNLARAVA